jgi:hypothetical protein
MGRSARVNDPDSDQAQQDMGGLAGLPGLATVREQLAGAIAVIRAEQAGRDAGVAVARPARKNMVFTGDPGGPGRSRKDASRRWRHGLGLTLTEQPENLA